MQRGRLTAGTLYNRGLRMTYIIEDFSSRTISRTTVTTHEGIDVSAYAEIPSSVVSILPSLASSKIMYRYTCYINPYQVSGPTGRNCRTHFKLQKNIASAGWTDVGGCEANEIFESAFSQPMCQRSLTMRFSLTPSAGSHSFRLVAKSFSSSYRSALHLMHFWSGSIALSGNAGLGKSFYPVAEVYEL